LEDTKDHVICADLPGSASAGASSQGCARAAGGVPEPSTWAMMLLGFGAMGFALRRRKRPALLAQIA